MKKSLLVLDFDQTITDWTNTLSKARADRLAEILTHMMKTFKVRVVILSMANMGHIYGTVLLSQSMTLIKLLLNDIQLITIEDREALYRVDRKRGESQRGKNDMITAVTGTRDYNDSPDHIVAYKKTHALLGLIRTEHLHPHDVYFLDDNYINIHFASHYGFRAYLVENGPMYKKLRLFERLYAIQRTMSHYS